jgi:hypothetical protein
MPSDWPRNSTRGRGTTTCRMSTQMELIQGGTIQSLTHDVTLSEIGSDIGRDPSMRNSIRSSTKESKFIAHWPTMPCLQGRWSTRSSPISPRIMKRSMHMLSGSKQCLTQQLSYPVPRKRERSLHTCTQDVQITRMATI